MAGKENKWKYNWDTSIILKHNLYLGTKLKCYTIVYKNSNRLFKISLASFISISILE